MCWNRCSINNIGKSFTAESDDLDFVFAHRDKLCLHKRVPDPDALYDGYDESDDTEEKARTFPLAKKK